MFTTSRGKRFTTTGGATVTAAQVSSPSESTLEKSELSVDVYPNPFRDKLQFVVNSGTNAAAKIILVDVSGRTVHQSLEKTNELIVIETFLTEGAYILQAEVGALTKRMRVVKVE